MKNLTDTYCWTAGKTLKTHWENIHAGEKPYSCQKCYKMYTHTHPCIHTRTHTHIHPCTYLCIFRYYTIVGVREVVITSVCACVGVCGCGCSCAGVGVCMKHQFAK